MNTSRMMMVALVSLLALSGAQGAFLNTYSLESPDMADLAIDDAATTVESLRHFTITDTTAVNVTLQLEGGIATTNATYSVDAYLSADNGSTETQIFAARANTTESTAYVAMDNTSLGLLRFVLNVPAPNRTAGEVSQSILIKLEDGTSFRHTLALYNYDPAVDSDVDHLDDEWETTYFGNLTASDGSQDTDGDGFTDREEFDAGTDPTAEYEEPADNLYSGAGGNVDDREVGILTTGLLVFSVVFFVGILIAADRTKKKRDLDEPMVATLVGGIGGALLVAFALLFFFDVFNVAGIEWAWWSAAQLKWEEWLTFGLASAAVLLAGGFALMKIPQPKEKFASLPIVGAVLALVITALLMFVVFDVALPWT